MGCQDIFLWTFLISLLIFTFSGSRLYLFFLVVFLLFLLCKESTLTGKQSLSRSQGSCSDPTWRVEQWFALLFAFILAGLSFFTACPDLPAEKLWQRQEEQIFRLLEREEREKPDGSRETRVIIEIKGKEIGHSFHRPYRFEAVSRRFDEKDLGSFFQGQLSFAPYKDSSLPGEFNEKNYKNAHGLSGKVEIGPCQKVKSALFPALRPLLKKRLSAKFDGLPQPASSFLKRIVLGSTMPMDQEMKTAMKELGLSHLLAASGLHVGLLYHWGLTLSSFLLHSRKQADGLIFGLLILYAWILDFPASIARALLFLLFSEVALLRKKQIHFLRRFLFSLVFYLLWRPYALTDQALLLSFLCSLALDRLAFWQKYRPLERESAKSLRASLLISLYTLPITAFIEPFFHPIVFLANWTAIPFFSLFFRLGLLSLIFQPLPLIGPLSGWLLQGLYQAFTYLLQGLQALAPGRISLDFLVSLPAVFLYYSSLIFILCLWKERRERQGSSHLRLHRQKFSNLLIRQLVNVAGLSFGFFILSSFFPSQSDPRLVMMDVGQGDCFLLQSGGANVLIDTGGRMNFANGENKQAPALARALKQLGVDRIHAVFLSHRDYDHIGNLKLLSQHLPLDQIYISPCQKEQLLQKTFGPLQKKVQQVQAGEAYSLPGGAVQLIPVQAGEFDAEDSNAHCLVLLAQMDWGSILFMGDQEKDELDCARKAKEIAGEEGIDILKLAHHGSKKASSEKFLDFLEARLALISSGLGNRYGHPNTQVIQRLEQKNIQILRTDFDGSWILTGQRGKIYMSRQREVRQGQVLFLLEVSLLYACMLHLSSDFCIEVQRPPLRADRENHAD